MESKKKPRPRLTDAERHKRFVEMAREVEASDSQKAFDKAFMRVSRVRPSKQKKEPQH